MLAKFVLIAGLVSTGGYVGYKVMNYDDAIYPYSDVKVRKMLLAATSTAEGGSLASPVSIYGKSESDRGVLLVKKTRLGDTVACEAMVKAVNPTESKVKISCYADPELAMEAPFFSEHVASTLHNRPYNMFKVDSDRVAVFKKGVDDQREEVLAMMSEYMEEEAEDGDDSISESMTAGIM